MSTSDFGFSIDIPVLREWSNIDGVRSSLQTCVAMLFQDVDYRHTLAMVAGELLENAIKYGHWTGRSNVVRVRVWGVLEDEAFVQVSNPVEDPARAELARRIIDDLGKATSAAEAYQKRILEIARSPARVSQLGLLRIAYEGGCALKAEVVDRTLTITASVPRCG